MASACPRIAFSVLGRFFRFGSARECIWSIARAIFSSRAFKSRRAFSLERNQYSRNPSRILVSQARGHLEQIDLAALLGSAGCDFLPSHQGCVGLLAELHDLGSCPRQNSDEAPLVTVDVE